MNNVLSVPILIHPSWALFWGLVGWLTATEYAPAAYPEHDTPTHWLQALLTNALIFGSVALHEAGHLVVAAGSRLRLQRVVLFPFGGVRTKAIQDNSWRDDFLLASAGPITSLAAGLVLIGAAPAGMQPLATWVGLFNVALAAINLAPAEPMDGAGILQALGRKRRTNTFELTRFSFRAADIMGTGLVWLGLAAIVITGRVEGLLLVLLGCLVDIANNVYRVKENPQQQRLLRKTPVAKAVADSPLSRRGVESPVRPVATQARPQQALSQVPGDGAALLSAVRPPLEPWSVPASATLLETLDRLDRPETPAQLFVVDGHRIIGVCSRADLLNYLFSQNDAVGRTGRDPR